MNLMPWAESGGVIVTLPVNPALRLIEIVTLTFVPRVPVTVAAVGSSENRADPPKYRTNAK